MLSTRVMLAVIKPTPPPMPAVDRRKNSASQKPPTITVWIGNTSYQAVRV